MNDKHEEIRRKLARHEPVPPPPDLLAKLKHQIPEHLTFASERERATVSTLRGSAWRIAASVILLAGVGWIGLTALKSSPAPFVRAKETQQASARPAPAFAPQLDAAAAEKTPQTASAPETPAPTFAKEPAEDDRRLSGVQPEETVATLQKKAAPIVRSEPAQPADALASSAGKDESADGALAGGAVAQSAVRKTEVAANEVKELEAPGQVASADLKTESGPPKRSAGATNAAPSPPPAAPAAAMAPAMAMRERAVSSKAAEARGETRQPVAIDCKPVVYPSEARDAKVQGVAIVAAMIGVDGKVESTELIQSLPHGLGRAAEEAVRNCHFQPAMLDGHPIRTRFEVPVRFDLEKGTCVICESGH